MNKLGQRLASASWSAHVSRLVVSIDRALLRRTRGRFGLVSLAGMDELILHTVGRRSGLPRQTPLLCIPDGDRILVAGSNWGKPSHPDWVFNLRSGGPVRITFGRTVDARVRELTGDERARAYAVMSGKWPAYRRYETQTTRCIPVFEIRI